MVVTPPGLILQQTRQTMGQEGRGPLELRHDSYHTVYIYIYICLYLFIYVYVYVFVDVDVHMYIYIHTYVY